LVTWLALRLEADFATTAFAYLLVVVLLSLMGSFMVSALLSVVAVGALNHFFARDIFSFSTDYPFDLVLVISFLLTSLLVSGLIGRVRRQTDAALKVQARAERAEREMRLAIDSIPILAWRVRPDGFVEYVNKPWLDYTGLSLEQARGSGWTRAVHPDDAAGMQTRWRAILESGKGGEVEGRARAADGEFRLFLSRAEPLRDEAGTIVEWYGTSIDIEERKRVEIALRESEQRFRDYTEMASDWLWQTGPDHRFTSISEHPATRAVEYDRRFGKARWDFATDRKEESREVAPSPRDARRS
jgi:PAS domain S-box-containing protein